MMRQQLTIAALMAAVALAKNSKHDKHKHKNDFQIEDVQNEAMQPLHDQSQEFQKFTAKYNKNYKNVVDFDGANNNWRKSKEKVRALNRANKGKGVKFGDNWTSDLDDDEFRAMLGLDTQDLVPADQVGGGLEDISDERRMLYSAKDWVTEGKMGPVKAQGYCGSCWSFSATTALEAMQAIKDNTTPVRLSEQEGVDCTTNTSANMNLFGTTYGTYGCRGGWMSRYWNFSRDQGSMSNADYPYVDYYYQGEVQACQHDDNKVASRVADFGQISTTVGDAVAKMQDGPLTMAVGAGNNCWRYYSGGVMDSDTDCGQTSLDHAVVAVGVAMETVEHEATEGESTTTCRRASRNERRRKSCTDGGVYRRKRCCTTTTSESEPAYTEDVLTWKVQNSWSEAWGDNGFIYLKVEGGAGVSGSNQVIEWVTAADSV